MVKNEMQLPANSDHVGTALLKRNALLARHPRVAAMVWFGSCGFCVGAIYGAFFARASSAILVSILEFGFWAAASALVPGLLIGSEIFDSTKVREEWDAAKCAAKIVVVSHVLAFVVGPLVASIFGNPFVSPGVAVCLGVAVALQTLVMDALLVFPVVCGGAVILFRLRNWSITPQGCAVHGYGEEKSAITGE